MSCLTPSVSDSSIPTMDVDVNVDVSGCNCCAPFGKKKKKKPKVDQSQEVEKTDEKVNKRSSTMIVFMSHEESKSGEEGKLD